jgi:signal transduction histidine kinase
MADTGKEERKRKLKEFYGILTIPIVLSVVNSIFFNMAHAALGAVKFAKSGYIDITAGNGTVLGTSFGLPFLLMYLMAYLWGRPAYRYAARPTEELKAKIRRRLGSVYRDAFIMIAAAQAAAIGLAALNSGGLSWRALAAAGTGFFAQAALLVVALDSHLSKQKELLPGLYSREELTALRPGFSLPVSAKISMSVLAFAVLPFGLIYVSVVGGIDLRARSVDLVAMLAASAVILLVTLQTLYQGIQLPLNGLIARMQRVAAGDHSKSTIYFSDEVAKLKAGFNGMVDGLREREARLAEAQARASRLESELAVAKATADLAAQVAHDIRSPLASLNAATRYLEMPEEQRRLVEGTVGRLKAIADGLLERYRAPGAARGSASADLAALLEEVVAEKRLQYRARAGLSIDFMPGTGRPTPAADPVELQRSVANLITNSAEAIDGSGTISVSLSQEGTEVRLSVKDNGRGIPADLLPRLGRKGETHGKPGGTGLGLYGAKTFAESCGGRLEIESAPGGTTVSLALPLPAAAAENAPAALLDNDMLVHMNWKFAAAQAGVRLETFTNSGEFLAALPRLDKATRLYIDSDLGDGVEGEPLAVAAREAGFGDITMETGHPPEKFSRLPWLKVTGKEPPWPPRQQSK